MKMCGWPTLSQRVKRTAEWSTQTGFATFSKLGFFKIAIGDPSGHTASGCRTSTCHRTALVGGWKPGRAKVAKPCFTIVSHRRFEASNSRKRIQEYPG